MGEFYAVNMLAKGTKPATRKKFSSRKQAEAWRTRHYRQHPRARVGILGKTGFW